LVFDVLIDQKAQPARLREEIVEESDAPVTPANEVRLSCGALKKDSFPNLRAPSASSAG